MSDRRDCPSIRHTVIAAVAASAGCVLAVTPSILAEIGQQAGSQNAQREIVPGEIIVKFDHVPNDGDLDLLKQHVPQIENWRALQHAPYYKGRPGVPHPLAYYRIISVPVDADSVNLANELTKQNTVVSAEPNGYTHIALVPDDSRYNQQYGPQIIESEAAWDITVGDSNVIIAVADTGINFTHEDFAGAIWNNDDPVNGRDDDDNGFVDDWRGWDFINFDNEPLDQHGHGSHTAGTAAARTNNSKGIAGMAQVTIMPLQVFSAGGGGTWEAIAEAITYATDNGASVLNYSGGGFGGAQVLADAASYAWDNGMPVVAAAGNYGSSTEFYPAAYPEVIAVAATDDRDNRASFSNFGNWIDVAAPGVDVLSCYYGGNASYTTMSGTSMASPHCAGLVALMYSVDPSLSPQDVRDLLRSSAKDLGNPGFDVYYGYGRIDAYQTLSNIGPGNCLSLSVDQLVAGQNSTFGVDGGTPGARAVLVYGFQGGQTVVNNVSGYCATFGIDGVTKKRVIGGLNRTFDGNGSITINQVLPGNSQGLALFLQAAEQNTCPDECVSNVVSDVIQ